MQKCGEIFGLSMISVCIDIPLSTFAFRDSATWTALATLMFTLLLARVAKVRNCLLLLLPLTALRREDVSTRGVMSVRLTRAISKPHRAR